MPYNTEHLRFLKSELLRHPSMKRLVIFLVLLTLQLTALPLFAQNNFDFTLSQPKGLGAQSNIGPGAQAEGLVQTIILNIITLFFAVGGIGVIIFFIWGAVDWIMSGGDKEKVSNARKKMTNAIIGLVILALSFAIIRVVGAIVGFDPLGNLQLPGLGSKNT